ncbi:MAG TPA: prepilin peptidase [Actinomycetota bacterium]|nr:prepilin peptidase [Actinomycetota bacterium]
MSWFPIVIALVLGLAFGSFMTVAIYRVPAGESLVRPRSRCPSCGAPIRSADNIPVISWLLLRGRCRACGVRISPVYPLTELACGGLFVAVALVYEDPWRAVLLAPFAGLMVALSVIDIRHRRIPNRLVYPAVVIAAAVIVAGDLAGGGLDVLDAGIGLFAYGLALLIIALISKGMGMGDVKLAGLIGLVLGSIGLDLVAVAAGMGILLGGVGAIVALLAGADRKSAIPYGPYLASGAVIAVFVGRHIADAYLNLLS